MDAIAPLGGDQMCYSKDASGWKIAGYLGGVAPVDVRCAAARREHHDIDPMSHRDPIGFDNAAMTDWVRPELDGARRLAWA